MSGWLSRAKALFQQPPPPHEPFEVECDCSGKVVGQRMSVQQKPVCSHCQRPVFVLPANVYPSPKPKLNLKAKTAKGVEGSKSSRAPSNLVIDDNQIQPPTESKSTSIVKSTTRRHPQKPVVDEPAILREPPKPWVTPLRLIAVAIVLMSTLTVGGLLRRHRIESAKVTVSKAADAGMAAIEEHDFPKAATELEKATLAVDILGRTDQAANDIRRYSREAKALANLATSTLTDCLQETLANTKPDQSEPARISNVHKGAWVIFDSNLTSASEGKHRYVVDAPFVLKEGVVRIEIESPLFDTVAKSDETRDAPRVIFAAQLEQLSSPKGKSLSAVLTLNGKSAFLWTSYKTYAAIGYQPVDAESERETRVILERQNEVQQKK